MMSDTPPPYTGVVMDLLQEGHPRFTSAFGRHIHWGYWEDPSRADGSDSDFAHAAEAMCRRLCDIGEISGGLAILDVGCGIGGTVAHLNERYSGNRLVGLNIDQRQLERAEQMVAPRPENSVRFVPGDACDLPFAEQEFDRVLAVECIFHFESRDVFFAEASRVLKPDGTLVLSDFVPFAPLALPFKLMDRLFTSDEMIQIYGRADMFCSLPGYRRLARRHGLVLDVAEDITANTLPSYPYVCNLLEQLKVRDAADDAFKSTTDLVARTLRRVEGLARLGAMRYKILSFRKETASPARPPARH